MPRQGPARPSRPAPPPDTAKFFKKLSIVLLADADSDIEELLGLQVGKMALDAAKTPPNGRYGRRGFYDNPKSKDFFDLMLDGFSTRWFRAWMRCVIKRQLYRTDMDRRMDRAAFWHIHGLIKDDPIFQSTGNRPQRPVHYQLAAFLIRCGSTSKVKTASVMSVSEGSVYNYMYRVGRALRNIRVNHLAWPGENRREYLSEAMSAWGFPGCLGSADGSYIRLMDKPGRNGFAYYCRKKFYAVCRLSSMLDTLLNKLQLIIQATVDHRGIFTSYDFGWPGSVQDSKVFKNSHLWTNRDEYFRPHEYILVDKGASDTFSFGCVYSDKTWRISVDQIFYTSIQ